MIKEFIPFLKRFLLASLVLLLISPAVFSATCSKRVTYCSNRETYECNCRTVKHSCQKKYSYECDCHDRTYECNEHEEEYPCTESVLLGYHEECIQYESVSYEGECSFLTYTFPCTKHYTYCSRYDTEPVYEDRETTCTRTVSDTCREEVCDTCTGYKKSTCYREECDSCSKCVRFSTRRKEYDCFDIKVTNVRVEEVKPGTVSVLVDYKSNVNKRVSFYFDLIRGEYGSCSKLTCGDPGGDVDCGVGGCESQASVSKQVGKGSGSVSYTINLPLFVSEGYKLRVGAWLSDELKDARDYGLVDLESFELDLNSATVGELVTGSSSSVELSYSSNVDESVSVSFNLLTSDNEVLFTHGFSHTVLQEGGSLTHAISPTLSPSGYTFRASVSVSGVLLDSISEDVLVVQGDGGVCSFSSDCASGYCRGGFCQTRSCNSYLSLGRGGVCDCNQECSSGLECERGRCVTPCSQSSACDSCLTLSKRKVCDCDAECGTNFCNSNGVCSIVSSFTFSDTKLCEDAGCSVSLASSVGVGSGLFLTGDLTGLSRGCDLSYELRVCGEEFTESINNCDDGLLFTIPAHSVGYCSVSLSLYDEVNEGTWSGSIGGFTVEESGEVINSLSKDSVGFEPARGGYEPREETRSFVNSVLTGDYDSAITSMVTAGMSNPRILNSLILSIVGVGGLITYNQRRRLLDYVEGLRSSVYLDRSVSNGMKRLGRLMGWGSLIGGLSVLGLGLLGVSTSPVVLPALAALGITGSFLEMFSHHYALRIESDTEVSKSVYKGDHSFEMFLDNGFFLWDVCTMGFTTCFSETIERTSKGFAEESVERTVKDLSEEFSGELISESSMQWVKRSSKLINRRLVGEGIKSGYVLMNKFLTESDDDLMKKLMEYSTESNLDYFFKALRKQDDEVVEVVLKVLSAEPELIRLLGNPQLFYNVVNLIKSIPSSDEGVEATITVLKKILAFSRKYNVVPSFELVESLGESPSEFVIREGGDEFSIRISLSKIDDFIEYTDFLVSHELKHYEYYKKGVDYTDDLLKHFDKETATEINNVLIDAKIDSELAEASPEIAKQIKEYERIFYEDAVINSLESPSDENLARLIYYECLGKYLDNNFIYSPDYISLNKDYFKNYKIIKNIIEGKQ